MGITCTLKLPRNEMVKRFGEYQFISWSYTGFGDFTSDLEKLDVDWQAWNDIGKAVDGRLEISKDAIKRILGACGEARAKLEQEKYSQKFTKNHLNMLKAQLKTYAEFFTLALENNLNVECS
ncbi:hypothetical protein HYS54_04940 [Candidatus Micrarchaeota archaeon]|nr:hypothetical protein [Candidatus Micrarchaeota archaeon]